MWKVKGKVHLAPCLPLPLLLALQKTHAPQLQQPHLLVLVRLPLVPLPKPPQAVVCVKLRARLMQPLRMLLRLLRLLLPLLLQLQ